jgi:hypothetical protein
MRFGKPIVAGLAVLTVAPASAGAATLHIEPGAFGIGHAFYTAGPGERNRPAVAFEADGQDFTISDPGAAIAPGAYCDSIDEHTAHCTAPQITLPNAPDWARRIQSFEAQLGDMDDRFTSPAGVAVVANGGPGSDVLEGGSGGDVFDGGGGRDVLVGGEGADIFTDGDSDSGAGPDRLDGGPDGNRVSYERRRVGVTIDLAAGTAGAPGENDVLTGFDEAVGGDGGDRISGTDDPNALVGNGGDDVITGLSGADLIEAGDGDDRVSGGAGNDYLDGGKGVDAPSCGTGRDVVMSTTLGELLGPLCDVVGVGRIGGFLPLLPRPTSVSRRAVVVRAACLPDPDEDYHPCRGTVKLHEAGGRRRLFARATFALEGHVSEREVRLRLTPLGRRLVSRRGGVLTDVSHRATFTDGTAETLKADWTIRLARDEP